MGVEEVRLKKVLSVGFLYITAGVLVFDQRSM
jgi:hypothetical protein